MEKTETTAGLNVVVRIIDKVYETGGKYAEDFKQMVTIEFDKHLPKWNYGSRRKKCPIGVDVKSVRSDKCRPCAMERILQRSFADVQSTQ